jgi:hypothetical protein
VQLSALRQEERNKRKGQFTAENAEDAGEASFLIILFSAFLRVLCGEFRYCDKIVPCTHSGKEVRERSFSSWHLR